MSGDKLAAYPSSSLPSGSGRHDDGVVRSQVTWLPWERRVWMVLLYFGAVSLYLARMTLPVAIVELAIAEEWNRQTCGVILSSFFWGYILLQMVGGALADRFGGDWVLWISGLVWSLATLLSVAAIPLSSVALIVVRFLTGLAQGVHFPAASSLVANRAPEDTKTYYFTVMIAGSSSGNVLAACLGALFINESHTAWRIFIVAGLVALLWSFVVAYFSFLSQPVQRTQYRLSDGGGGQASHRQRLRLVVPQVSSSVMASCASVPWRKLLRQPPVIALLLSHLSSCFFSHNLMFWLPTFFTEIFPNRYKLSWLYNGLPWVAMATGALTGGWLTRKLLARDVSLTRVRKLLALLCLGGGGCLLLLLTLLLPLLPSYGGGGGGGGGDGFPSTLLLVALAFFCNGTGSACFLVNPSDLSPTFVGSLSGIMNTFGTLPGMFGVTLTGHILHTTGSWPLVFSLITGANLLAVLLYLSCGSAKRLPLDPS